MQKTDSSDKNSIARNTIFLYFRMLFTMFVSLYTSRIVLQVLGVEDFGIYNVVGGVIALFSFLNSSMVSSSQRYLAFAISQDEDSLKTQTFNVLFSTHLIIALLIFVLGETIGLWFVNTQLTIPDSRLDAANWVYQFSVYSCILGVVGVPYNATIIAHEKMNIFAYFSIVNVSLKLFSVYLLFILDFDKLVVYAFFIFCISVVDIFLQIFYCQKKFQMIKYSFDIDRKLFKNILCFSGWNLFGNIAGLAYTQGINILLNIFFGPAVNAARGIAIQIQGAINSFNTNLQVAFNPQIIKTFAANELGKMHSLIFRSSKFSFLLLFTMSLPVLLETKIILELWLKVVPEYSVNFIRIILSIMLVDSMSGALSIAAQATGKVKKYQVLVGGLLLLILPISFVALKSGFKPESVFFIHLSISLVAQVIRFNIVRKMIFMNIREYIKKVLYPIGKVIFFSLGLSLLLYFSQNRFEVVIFGAVLSVLIFSYFLGLNSVEREWVQKKVISRLKKRKK